MHMQSVTSSNIAAIGYEGDKLEIQFNNGRTYRYHEVPQEVADALLNADSVGKYFAAHIKNQYPTEQV